MSPTTEPLITWGFTLPALDTRDALDTYTRVRLLIGEAVFFDGFICRGAQGGWISDSPILGQVVIEGPPDIQLIQETETEWRNRNALGHAIPG